MSNPAGFVTVTRTATALAERILRDIDAMKRNPGSVAKLIGLQSDAARLAKWVQRNAAAIRHIDDL